MSVYVGESRGELLSWLNELLLPPTPFAKVEQCGTGSIYCQVMDSIFGNLPMSKVKFNARQEYEYLDNFKILQKCFSNNRIDKPIPVERLVKCKMQDNLEFLQWMKKFWDAHATGSAYDAAGRAGGAVPAPGPSTTRAPTSRPVAARTPGSGAARSVSSASNAQLQALNAQVQEMQIHCESLEKERDFYFDKLRQIELSVSKRLEEGDLPESEQQHLASLQAILYATQEGFEVPDPNAPQMQEEEEEEEETF